MLLFSSLMLEAYALENRENELAGLEDLTITIASVANCFFHGETKTHGVDNKWFRLASIRILNLCQTYKARPFQTV